MKEKFLLGITLFLATLLRVYLVWRDSIPLAQDMGRDLLWAKDISFYHIPTLIGPQGSIWGVYFGPLWFYFLAIPLFITGGNPLSAVYATLLTIVASGLLAYILFKKHLTSLYALFFSVIILFSAHLISLSNFAFHANLLPILTLLLIYFCLLAVIKNPLFIALALFCASLMFHADPVPAIVFSIVPPFIFIYFRLYKSKNQLKTLTASLLAYLVPFAPQILFEIRNNFVQTRSLLSYFAGNNPSLSGQLPFFQRIPNRIAIYFEFFKNGFAAGNNIFAGVFLIFIILGIYHFIKPKRGPNILIFYKITFLCSLLTFLIFTLIITVEVKGWYLNGLSILIALLITLALYGLKKYKLIIPIFFITYISLNLWPFLKNDQRLSSKKDPARLSNQLQAVNLIYDDVKNSTLPYGRQVFSVYTFTPPIYDLNYQYLFWWQGEVKQRGLPQEFAYLPSQPAYVRNKAIYQKNPQQSKFVYLIIEQSPQNEFYTQESWLKNFEDLKSVWQKDINGAIIVQKKIKTD